jgi:hypothetical protein
MKSSFNSASRPKKESNRQTPTELTNLIKSTFWAEDGDVAVIAGAAASTHLLRPRQKKSCDAHTHKKKGNRF